MSKKILVIEDDQSMRWVLEKALGKEGHKVTTAPDGRSGIAAALEVTPDLVVLDILMPDIDGLTVLRKLKESRPQVPVLIITAQNIMTHAVEAMRRGAYDYLPKPFDVTVLVDRVARGLAQAESGSVQKEEEPIPAEMEDMIGQSPLMEGLFKAMGRVAASEATVLVLGESGTGKELVAKAIHRFSNRASGPFVAVNASAIPSELLESEDADRHYSETLIRLPSLPVDTLILPLSTMNPSTATRFRLVNHHLLVWRFWESDLSSTRCSYIRLCLS